MRSLLDAAHKATLPKNVEEVWALNLDQIESHSGKVLAKLMLNRSEVGPSTYVFNKGTVLYCKLRPYLNKVVVADDDGVATTELVPLRCDESKVLPTYLAHFLRSAAFLAFATNVVAGAKMPRMVMSEFWSYPVPLPPLEEQHRIAAILDQAETLRTQRRTALALLDSLTQSLFLDMFGEPVANDRGWPEAAVSDFVAGFESGKSLVADDEDNSASIYRVLKVSAVTSLEYKPEESKAVPTDYRPPQSHIVRPGDLLFSRANTSELIGATAFVDATPDNLLLPDKLWRFVWKQPSNTAPLYVRHLFQQPKFRREVGQRASGTSGSMKNISQEKVLSIQVGLPPLPLQQTFATRIQSIEALKATHRRALTALDALFASLQQRAFAGDL
jgi:type I restriction enzyme S subunit